MTDPGFRTAAAAELADHDRRVQAASPAGRPVTGPADPLTCEHCKHAPATHLLAADIGIGRVTQLVCEQCGSRGVKDAGAISRAASAVWLFVLTPVQVPE